MQEVPAVKSVTSDPFEQLRSAALVDTSSQARAFSDFMSLLGRSGQERASTTQQGARADIAAYAAEAAPHASQATQTHQAAQAQQVATQATQPAPRVEGIAPETMRVAVDSSGQSAPNPLVQGGFNPMVQGQQPATQARQVKSGGSAQSGAASQSATSTGASETRQASARNAKVSREAFEELKPALAKAGLSDKEIEDLASRVQAGTLTWGKLVHTLAGAMSGAKKPVELSAEQSQGMAALFQKLGFSSEESQGMVKSVAAGEGLKVLSTIQQKLATLPDDMSLNLGKDELSGLFKALRLPKDASDKLAAMMSGDKTVADLKEGLSQLGQALQEQRARGNASDTDLARAVGRIMEKDVAKAGRDASQTTGGTQNDSSSPHITFDVKTKDKNDTSWFEQREKNKNKSDDAAWRDFMSKVRPEGETAAQARGSQSTGSQGGLDGLSAKGAQLASLAQQGRTETSQQARAFDKVAAPRMLDQVQEALLKDLGQGRKQMTINLDPETLGKLQVQLQVRDKDVHAVLRAEDADTAKLLTAQLDTIRKTLEDQGLKVQQLEVQTGLSGSGGQQAQFSADQHNQAQERQELSRIFSQLRMLRSEGGDVARDMQNDGMQAILAERGLHIVA